MLSFFFFTLNINRGNFFFESSTDQSIDMLDWFSKMTLEVILSTAFGVDAKIQMRENTEMLKEAKKLFQIPQVVRQISRLPFGTLLFPLLGRITGVGINYMQGVAEEIIKSRRQQGLRDGKICWNS